MLRKYFTSGVTMQFKKSKFNLLVVIGSLVLSACAVKISNQVKMNEQYETKYFKGRLIDFKPGKANVDLHSTYTKVFNDMFKSKEGFAAKFNKDLLAELKLVYVMYDSAQAAESEAPAVESEPSENVTVESETSIDSATATTETPADSTSDIAVAQEDADTAEVYTPLPTGPQQPSYVIFVDELELIGSASNKDQGGAEKSALKLFTKIRIINEDQDVLHEGEIITTMTKTTKADKFQEFYYLHVEKVSNSIIGE